MAPPSNPPSNPQLSPARAILYGTLVVGTLDALDALIFFGWRGAKPIQIFQGIATGYLGRASFEGGLPTALLGAVTHYFIAFAIVATYVLASRKLPLLTRHAVPCGLLYGVLVYLVMNFVVIPLSAAHHGAFTAPLLLNGLFAHTLLIGLPSAFFARAAARAAAPGNAR